MQSFDLDVVASAPASAALTSSSTSSSRSPLFLARLLSRLPRRGSTRFQRLAAEDEDGSRRRSAGPLTSSGGGFFEDDNEPGSDADDGDDVLSPEDSASPFSLLLFSFATPLINLGSLKPLEQGDLWPLSRRDRASRVARDFAARLRASASTSTSTSPSSSTSSSKKAPRHHPRGSVAAAAVSAHGRAFAAAGAIKLFHDCVMFLPPYLLERLLKHKAEASSKTGETGGASDAAAAASSSSSRKHALLLALALAAAGAAEPLIINQYFHRLFRVQLALKAQLVDCLFARALRCSVAARDRRSTGAVANLMSNDAAKLFGLPQYLHMIWSAPFQVRGGGRDWKERERERLKEREEKKRRKKLTFLSLPERKKKN